MASDGLYKSQGSLRLEFEPVSQFGEVCPPDRPMHLCFAHFAQRRELSDLLGVQPDKTYLCGRDTGALQEMLKENPALTSPGAVRDYLRLRLAARKEEAFVCMWLDAQHKVIDVEEPFKGTLTQTSVYPREIVKSALRYNAAAVIFAHNHPSGVAQPSQSDELLTRNLKEALALVEVKVLDHFIVAGHQAISFAERGLL